MTVIRAAAGAAAFSLALAFPARAAGPALSLSPSSLDFGRRQTGTTGPGQQINVWNSGDQNLTISSTSLGGASPGDFGIAFDNCSGATLSPGSIGCQMTLVFSPNSTGAKAAALVISSNAPGSPHSVPLTGEGVPPSLMVTPFALDFGEQIVGDNGPTQTVNAWNDGTGGGPVSIFQVSIGGPDAASFEVVSDGCSNTVLQSGTFGCQMLVRFRPGDAGSKTATLSVPTDAPNSPRTAALSGTGALPLMITPTSVLFGSVPVGQTGTSQEVSVFNRSSTSYLISSVALAGAHPGDFVLTDGCGGLTLGPNGFCSIGAAFRPTTTGARLASIQIASTAPGSPFQIGLAGQGSGPQISVVPGTLDFGTGELGATTPEQGVFVTNTGDAPLQIFSVQISGTAASSFVLAGGCAGSLPSGQSCETRVAMRAAATGPLEASLVIASNAGNRSVALTGSGVDTTPPASTWTTTDNAVRISSFQTVGGESFDLSGIASASLTFTDVFGSQTPVTATLGPCSQGGRLCPWTAQVPLLLPGPYTVQPAATDRSAGANVETNGPQITVVVV